MRCSAYRRSALMRGSMSKSTVRNGNISAVRKYSESKRMLYYSSSLVLGYRVSTGICHGNTMGLEISRVISHGSRCL